MPLTCNSSQTNQLLARVRRHDEQALASLFGRHCERLRKMVRLRLDPRLRERFTSSQVLEEVLRQARGHVGEYPDDVGESFFLWLRNLTGRTIQQLHRQHLGEQADEAGQRVSLYRDALPPVHSVSLAAQLMGNRRVHQAAVRADMLLRLQEVINAMDPLDREVLALLHFEELKDNEAAVVLGLDRDTTSLRYVMALKRLKGLLKSVPGFGEN